MTSFEVVAYGHTPDGRLGAAKATLESRLPFNVEPKLPVEVSNTDKIRIPVSINNNTAARRDVELSLEATGLDLGKEKRHVRVEPRKNVSELFEVRPTILEGTVELLFTARSQPFGADRVRRSFTVVPKGFPQVGKQSDVLEGVETRAVDLPETWVPGTLNCQLQVFPSTLADLQKGLESLLRQPGGCFEQSSSSNYPNVLILDYLKSSDQAMPEVEQRARTLLTSGYRQLTSFECIDPKKRTVHRGYEWFGQTAPPHEALTAYGLLEFRDMARVFPVDKDMIERTRKYLLDQRDGNGGFKRNSRAIDSFGRAPRAHHQCLHRLGADRERRDRGGPRAGRPGQAGRNVEGSRTSWRWWAIASSTATRPRRAWPCSRSWPATKKTRATSTRPRPASPIRAATTCGSRRRR